MDPFSKSGQDRQTYANSNPCPLVTGKQEETAFYIRQLATVCTKNGIQVLHLTLECCMAAWLMTRS